MQTTRYYLIDMTHIDAIYALRECKSIHQNSLPKNNLSIVYSNDLTQGIVKVVGNDIPPFGSELITTFTKDTHIQVLNKLQLDSAWMDSKKTQSQRDALETRLQEDKVNI